MKSINFKVDSGAAVTALPAGLSRELKVKLTPTNKKLRAAGNQILTVKGKAIIKLKTNQREVRETVFFVDSLVTPLLGKPTIKKLRLIKFVNEVDTVSANSWVERFPKLFTGLGSMKTSVNITLKEEAIPFAQAVPRRIAAARREPLKKELERMESLGVIQKIEAPTKWCAPCIVVPKKNQSIRVCIDFTRLNQAVLREYHPLPTTEETLSSLGNAKIFSQLDANSGYWQLRLSEQAQKLTTFITPFGRYFCRRLPFGISSAPEIFQREMQKALEGLEGVTCQMDDILIGGDTQEEHDSRVEAVLQRLVAAGITLNPDKCGFSKTEVKFLGHIINKEGIHVDPEKTRAIRELQVTRRNFAGFLGSSTTLESSLRHWQRTPHLSDNYYRRIQTGFGELNNRNSFKN